MIDRVVEWAGATLQAPHRAISAQRGIAPEGVYVAYLRVRLAGDRATGWCRDGASSRSTASRRRILMLFCKR